MTLKVAWITHRDGSIQGGAEFADSWMIDCAPQGVEVEVLSNKEAISLNRYYSVVLAGELGMDPALLQELWERERPFVAWSHGIEGIDHPVYQAPKVRAVALTPKHKNWMERRKIKVVQTNIGWIPEAHQIEPREKEDFLLWAHRDVWHKGKDAAQLLAERMGVEFVAVSDKPREEVLGLMERARYFALISYIPDAGPLACVEARLAGCELLVNDHVGLPEETGVELLATVLGNGARFWWEVMACGSQ